MFPQGVSDVVSRPKDTATSEIGDHTTLAHSVFKDAAIYTGENKPSRPDNNNKTQVN